MIQSAETRRTLHTHTHTHTHTGKLLPSIKQIVPICFAFYFIIFPNFTFADNITDASTCTNGVLGTYTGPANIEANFDPNTINTTWYSNGTAMSGNGVPSSCTYAAPLTPPTPADRPGYVFGGWKLKAACSLAGLDASVEPTAYALGGGRACCNGVTTDTYGLTQADQFGLTFPYGTIVGEGICSKSGEEIIEYEEGENQDGGGYCFCHITKYTLNGAQECDVSSVSPMVLQSQQGMGCPDGGCAKYCMLGISGWSEFDAMYFNSLVVNPAFQSSAESLRQHLYGQTQ